MLNCPNCNSNAVGKVGSEQFYCWNCFVEYNIAGGKMQIFDIAEDGTLVSFNQGDVDGSLS